jgi:hypothetical protein
MQKMFDIKEFKDKDIAVHCRTEICANIFLKILHEHGMKWVDGWELLYNNNWIKHEENTCYVYNAKYTNIGIQYSDCGFYIEEGYEIIDFSILRSKELAEEILNA